MICYPLNPDINKICEIAVKAGEAVMSVYTSVNTEVEMKEDNTPLTRADIASHNLIKSKLEELYPGIPVLSEEGKNIPYELRKNWDTYWLIDPLDGTKEFVKRNGEFTVNIALMKDSIPVIGVVYLPVKDILYFAGKGKGAFMKDGGSAAVSISVNKDLNDGVTGVRSRSHKTDEEEKMLQRFGVTEIIYSGSSIKFCLIAEGKADVYFRAGPTSEWDTAAAQVILEEAGGKVLDATTEKTLRYNKEILLNNPFIALGGLVL